jgi:hypothetical protein
MNPKASGLFGLQYLYIFAMKDFYKFSFSDISFRIAMKFFLIA